MKMKKKKLKKSFGLIWKFETFALIFAPAPGNQTEDNNEVLYKNRIC